MTARAPDRRPPAVFLMGQTAAGKTGIAVELARRLPLGIVSVDSAMVYRGMDIGTAKPAAEILRDTPHRLIDICDPVEAYSAARFRADALRAMDEITAAGGIPLLTGGTLLYFRALEQGLSELPAADPGLRARLAEEGREQGWPALHDRLARLDPRAAARIHPNDPQRIQRALEVHALEGRAMSELLAAGRTGFLPYRVIKIKLVIPERETLHRRLAERFHGMLELGLLAEVEGLYRRGGLHPGLPAIRAVGYRQLWRYLEGEGDYREAVERAIIATRQLAKRQMTWLRRESGGWWFDGGSRNIFDKVLKLLADGTIYGKHGS